MKGLEHQPGGENNDPGHLSSSGESQGSAKPRKAREQLGASPLEKLREETVVFPGVFLLPRQQPDGSEGLAAQRSGREYLEQEEHAAPPRRRGPREKPPEHASTGELYIGSLIRKLRQEKGLQVEQAADLLGYNRASLSKIETNQAIPSEEKLQKMAALLEVPIEELKKAPEHPRIWQTPLEKLKNRFSLLLCRRYIVAGAKLGLTVNSVLIHWPCQ
jgi:transcriptional regulator with XRE-family HTH domain